MLCTLHVLEVLELESEKENNLSTTEETNGNEKMKASSEDFRSKIVSVFLTFLEDLCVVPRTF